MSRPDRRALLRLAAGAAIWPLVSAAAPPRAGAAGPVISPPPHPMIYTRRLERVLPGGARFLVDRSFGVQFEPAGAGFRVDGHQVGVEVLAPDALAEFARLERERKETGLFPLLLDERGLILGLDGPGGETPLDDTVRALQSRLDQSALDADQRGELRQFASAVQQTAGQLVALLPRDLFAPLDSPRMDRREIALPGGGAGFVAVSFVAARDPATGLMREASREVVTDLSGEQRRTVESWRLERASA